MPPHSTRTTRRHFAHFSGADSLPKVGTKRTLRPLSKVTLSSKTRASSPAGAGPAPQDTSGAGGCGASAGLCPAVTRGSPTLGNEPQPRSETCPCPVLLAELRWAPLYLRGTGEQRRWPSAAPPSSFLMARHHQTALEPLEHPLLHSL